VQQSTLAVRPVQLAASHIGDAMIRPSIGPRAPGLALALAVLAGCLAVPAAAQAAPLTVRAENATKPTQCAEEDNVYVKLFSAEVTRFRVSALQPAYMRPGTVDVTGPNFTNCAISDSQDFRFTPKEVVLYEDAKLIIKGFTFARFWRQAVIPTSVGGKTTEGLHLIQVFTKRAGAKPFEFLVLYPPDGYWRARPLTLPGYRENVYGSSFLIGPIEERERPVADVVSVEIKPRERLFKLTFKAGGSATLHFGEPNTAELPLTVTLVRKGADPALPFAAVRSMFVSETNADTARVVWQEKDDPRLHGSGIEGFKKAEAVDIRFDRAVPSVHNTSAPDMRFWRFAK
jgi:hypothetical protein